MDTHNNTITAYPADKKANQQLHGQSIRMALSLTSLFQPARFVMDKLSYRKKFSVLCLLAATAVTFILYGFFTTNNQIVVASSDKLSGLRLIKPLAKGIQSAQIHRGLSAGIIGGDLNDMRRSLSLSEASISTSIDQFKQALPPDFSRHEELGAIEAEWFNIQQSGLRQTLTANFDAHTQLIKHLLDLQTAIANKHGLIFDPSVHEFYLYDTIVNKLPRALEQLGRVRGRGVGILAEKSLSKDDENTLKQLVNDLKTALASLNSSIESIALLSPSADSKLLPNFSSITRDAYTMINVVENDIYTRQFSTPPSEFILFATGLIDQGYSSLYQLLLPSSELLLTEKISRSRQSSFTVLVIAGLISLVTFYFVIGHHISFYDSIKTIQNAAKKFSEGHTGKHITLASQDELAKIAASFNTMVDGFNNLLAESRQNAIRTQTVINTALDAVIQMDHNGVISYWNLQAETIFGWSETEAIGSVLSELIVPEQYRQAHASGLKRFLDSGLKTVIDTRLEIIALHREGYEFPIELGISHINNHDKHEFSAFIRDITDKKKTDELIWTQANFDTLTGLPNRQMFHNRLEEEVKKAARTESLLCLMFLDLDNFKQVNDSLGHSMGDLLLKETARRIGCCVRDSDAIARLGGDEFTVILPDLSSFQDAEEIAKNIINELALPFHLYDEVVHISTSIGITLFPNDAETADDLIKNADHAMYQAKRDNYHAFRFFTQSMQDAILARSTLISALRNAIENNEFVLHYQPIFHLSTGKIIKLEALIRWQHPTDGMISPLAFIPLAEETGLINEIGEWVFSTATQQLKQWQVEIDPALKLSINMSPVQFYNDHGHQHWAEILDKHNLPSGDITIEITESLLLESNSVTTQQIEDLRLQGFKFAIDDFGTGYSSLAYLKRFRLDFLKIDQSFVKNLTPDSDDAVLTETIVLMAKSLGLETIAEGIETAEQQEMLIAAGCVYGQGYFLAKPLTAEKISALLSQNRSAHA